MKLQKEDDLTVYATTDKLLTTSVEKTVAQITSAVHGAHRVAYRDIKSANGGYGLEKATGLDIAHIMDYQEQAP